MIGQIHDACRILFQSGLNYLNGCEEVEKQIPQSPERDRLIRFIRESQRGIVKPYSPNSEKRRIIFPYKDLKIEKHSLHL